MVHNSDISDAILFLKTYNKSITGEVLSHIQRASFEKLVKHSDDLVKQELDLIMSSPLTFLSRFDADFFPLKAIEQERLKSKFDVLCNLADSARPKLPFDTVNTLVTDSNAQIWVSSEDPDSFLTECLGSEDLLLMDKLRIQFNNKLNEHTFIYRAVVEGFYFSDVECSTTSDKTFDIKYNDIADNENVLELLKIWYPLSAPYKRITKIDRRRMVAVYIESLSQKQDCKMYSKLYTNPTLRVFIHDDELLTQIKSLLGLSDNLESLAS